ncbi:enolase C-terminal domain-like protein [Arthrobacter castelli]|uniref:enolase C-terminal domain-like protein n=1 Tax=Arthrobacter castelli TaxID=271431 RepID=UPI00040E7AAE|nr:enolase C-terminal domain-like protein [Arthrobacter castelli]
MTSSASDPVVDGVHASAYTVPTDAPEADGTLAWSSTTMVLVQVQAAGHTGLGWTYGPPACAAVVSDTLAGVVGGRTAMDVGGSFEAMVRAVRNQGRQGIAGYAISAVDVALWDLKARILDQPLYRLFGAQRAEVPVYGSGGFTSYSHDQLRRQLTRWVEAERMPRVKIKIGQSWGSDQGRDLERIAQARKIVGDETELYVDANGAYSRKQAVRVARAAAGEGVVWLEEPVSSDHLEALAEVRAAVDIDIAAGEYGFDLFYFEAMCAAGAVDCLQVDATRCGGMTEWFRAAAVAAAHGLQVSGHCAPHLHAHAAAAIPNMRHLEWFHDHVRIENLLFDGTLPPTGGAVRPDPDAPGLGLTLRTDDAAPYQVA